MISASKSPLSLNHVKILRLKVTKNLTNLCKKFCESPPRDRKIEGQTIVFFFYSIKNHKHKKIKVHFDTSKLSNGYNWAVVASLVK